MEKDKTPIPDWALDKLYKALESVSLIEQIKMLPTGRDTPQGLGIYISNHGSGDWNIHVNDWYGDRSSIVIAECSTSAYISFEEALYYVLRDTLSFVNRRYPEDKYLVKCVKRILELSPELKEMKYFSNYIIEHES